MLRNRRLFKPKQLRSLDLDKRFINQGDPCNLASCTFLLSEQQPLTKDANVTETKKRTGGKEKPTPSAGSEFQEEQTRAWMKARRRKYGQCRVRHHLFQKQYADFLFHVCNLWGCSSTTRFNAFECLRYCFLHNEFLDRLKRSSSSRNHNPQTSSTDEDGPIQIDNLTTLACFLLSYKFFEPRRKHKHVQKVTKHFDLSSSETSDLFYRELDVLRICEFCVDFRRESAFSLVELHVGNLYMPESTHIRSDFITTPNGSATMQGTTTYEDARLTPFRPTMESGSRLWTILEDVMVYVLLSMDDAQRQEIPNDILAATVVAVAFNFVDIRMSAMMYHRLLLTLLQFCPTLKARPVQFTTVYEHVEKLASNIVSRIMNMTMASSTDH